MHRTRYFISISMLVLMNVGLTAAPSESTDDFTSWPVLSNPFESTSGGGVLIDGYMPVVEGALCRTDFSVKLPDQEHATIFSVVEFDARSVAGGVLCENGRWRTKDGKDTGTTPFRVFIKDGIVRRPPAR